MDLSLWSQLMEAFCLLREFVGEFCGSLVRRYLVDIKRGYFVKHGVHRVLQVRASQITQ